MKAKMIKRPYLFVSISIILLFLFFNAPRPCYSQSCDFRLSMAPSKIILNSELKGDRQDLQAIIPIPLTTYYNELNNKIFQIYLYIDNETFITALSHRYCSIDENLLVSFSREDFTQYFNEEATVSPLVEIKLYPDPITSLDEGASYTACSSKITVLNPGNK